MYLLVITDDLIGSHQAATFDSIETVTACLIIFKHERGFHTMLLKLNPKTEIYEEIFPEDFKNDN